MDIYKIGIEFGLHANWGFFSTFGGKLAGLNNSVLSAQDKIAGLRTAIIGLGVAFAGVKTLKILYEVEQKGADLQHQIALLSRQGAVTTADVNLGVQAAYQAAEQVPGAGTTAEMVGLIRELNSQMPSMAAAASVLPYFAQLKETLGAFSPDGQVSDAALLDALKAIELRGHGFVTDPKTGVQTIDPAAFKVEADALERALIASGGLLTAHDARQMISQAGPAARLMNPDAFYGEMGEMAVIMGASKAGTAMLSMFNQLAEGTMTGKVADNLVKAKLLDPSHVHHGKGGQVTVDPGSIEDASLFYTDPAKWLNWAFAKLKAQHPKESQQDLFVQFMSLFGRQTTQREAAEATQAYAEVQNKLKNYKATAGAEDNAAYLAAHDPTTIMNAFNNSFQSLLQTLGSPMVATVNSILIGMTHAFSSLTDWAQKHPTLVGDIEKIAAGLGVMAVVIGGTAFVAGVAALATGAGSFATMALGVTASVTAIGTLIAILPDLTKGIESLLPNWANPDNGIPGGRGNPNRFNGLPTQEGPFAEHGHWKHIGDRPVWVPDSYDYTTSHAANPYLIHSAYIPDEDQADGSSQSGHQSADGHSVMTLTPISIYVDGKLSHREIVKQIVRGMRGQQTGMTGHDTSMGIPNVGPAISI